MSGPATLTDRQQLIDAAKAPIVAFNRKDWDAVRAGMSLSGFVYDEVGTGRRAEGADQAVPLWQAWAGAFPDANASFDQAAAAGDTVVLEVTWRGTHRGPLQTPAGAIPPSENRFEVRACLVIEMDGDKVRRERHYFDMGTLLRQLGVSAG
jgi:steroid delta-isomerase-like uncharacterized protein